MRWVKQEDPSGCGIACLAMITGRTYAQVLDDLIEDPRYERMMTHRPHKEYRTVQERLKERGVPIHVIQLYLYEHNFWTQRRYRTHFEDCPPWHNTENWPCEPWAPGGHIAEVVQSSGNGHYVVLDTDGTVLDPLREGRFGLRDWETIKSILGVTYSKL